MSALGGASAILGGAFWVGKGMAILLTGAQPPYLFEIAPVLLAAALIGLHTRLGQHGSASGRIGLVLAVVSGILAISSLIFTLSSTNSEEFSPLIFGSFLANLGGLVFLGVATRRVTALPGPWSLLPLVMGVSTFPLIALGGALASINERLLEPPLVLIGLAWMWMGYLLISSSRSAGGERSPAA